MQPGIHALGHAQGGSFPPLVLNVSDVSRIAGARPSLKATPSMRLPSA
jgi:hypothetical protein